MCIKTAIHSLDNILLERDDCLHSKQYMKGGEIMEKLEEYMSPEISVHKADLVTDDAYSAPSAAATAIITLGAALISGGAGIVGCIYTKKC